MESPWTLSTDAVIQNTRTVECCSAPARVRGRTQVAHRGAHPCGHSCVDPCMHMRTDQASHFRPPALVTQPPAAAVAACRAAVRPRMRDNVVRVQTAPSRSSRRSLPGAAPRCISAPAPPAPRSTGARSKATTSSTRSRRRPRCTLCPAVASSSASPTSRTARSLPVTHPRRGTWVPPPPCNLASRRCSPPRTGALSLTRKRLR